MSTQGNGQPVVYDVRISDYTKSVLKKLYKEARLAGKNKQFLANVSYVVERLRKDPLNLGEPLYRLPALKLTVCQAVVDRLVVVFGVHEELPLVFIREFKVLS